MKTKLLSVLIIIFMSGAIAASAQVKEGVEKWIDNRVEYFTKELKLTEDQAQQVHACLMESARNIANIQETLQGEEQNKALWKNVTERKRKMSAILTDEQNQKLKALEEKEQQQAQQRKEAKKQK